MEESEGIAKKIIQALLVRFWQLLVMVRKYFETYGFPEIREGPGRARGLGIFLRDKGIDHVLVITGRQLLEDGIIQPALDSMTEAGIDYSVEAFYRSNPIPEDVENTCQAYLDRHRAALVAIGGRSRIDCAKIVASHLAGPRLGPVSWFRGAYRAAPMLVAVPASAGTGAEAAIDATLTDPWSGAKRMYRDPIMLPRYVILDPELMEKSPAELIARSGMEAICHIVEGYLNILYCSAVEKRLAVEAIHRLQRSLVRAYQDPSDYEAVQDVQYAGMLGARIANRCGHGYAFALAHAIEQTYGVTHGEAIGAIFPATLRVYKGRGARRMGVLAEACGFAAIGSEESAFYLQRWVTAMQVSLHIDQKFKDLRNSDFEMLIAMTQSEALPGCAVPEILDKDNMRNLLRSLQD